MIEIVKVESKREQKRFLNLPLNMYKGNKCFVPPLYSDEASMFKKNYVYNDQSESIFFNAYLDGRHVGRIQGIIQKASNEKWNEKKVRFTRFDSIDNQEVASALFKAVEEWAISNGMDTVVGPLGYSDLEREGLLIEGFDELSTFEEQYNYPYYQKLIENLGYTKDVDWVERKLYAPKEVDPRFERLCSVILRRNKLKIAETKSISDFIQRYGEKLFKVLDITYDNLYGTVPFSDGMRKMIINNFKLILNKKYFAVIVDEEDNVVCFGICIPSIAKAVQKSNGHLTLPAIGRILRAIRKPEVLDLALIGVLPEYQMKGVSSVLIYEIMKYLLSGEIKYAETNLNLEDNVAIQNQWKSFDNVLHKRRRSFIKHLNN